MTDKLKDFVYLQVSKKRKVKKTKNYYQNLANRMKL